MTPRRQLEIWNWQGSCYEIVIVWFSAEWLNYDYASLSVFEKGRKGLHLELGGGGGARLWRQADL